MLIVRLALVLGLLATPSVALADPPYSVPSSPTTPAPTPTAVAGPADPLAGTPVSPAGPLGMSVNAGAQFTNTPEVTLNLRWPRGYITAFVSNDGGFYGAGSIPLAPTIPWTLNSSGSERLPKTVYVRYLNSSGNSSTDGTFQDDIILDQTAPVVESAGFADPASAAIAARARKVRLRIKARDANSGVATMQVGASKSAKLPRVAYAGAVRVKATRRVYVRVFDAAGNASRWKLAKRR